MMAATPGLAAFAALTIGFVPGFFLFRLPVLRRELRAQVSAEERWFWYIVLSVGWSLAVTMALAAASAYTFPRLIGINLALGFVVLAIGRRALAWRGTAPRPTITILAPLLLVALGAWRFLPASEYIIGGKDPGVYVNEGVSIDRTGTLFRKDAVVTAVSASTRELFFTDAPPTEYWGIRFMGVFLDDPETGAVIPGFPHLLPASIAVGYGIAGIRGATTTVSVWALLGLLAVYFFGTRLTGRAVAFSACALLALNVIEVWFGRYPNAEVVMQALLFAALLAVSRTLRDDDRYFGWVAGTLAVLLIFLRFDAYLAIAGIGAAVALMWIVERRWTGWAALALLAAGSLVAWKYYTGPMRAYFWQYSVNLPEPWITAVALIAGIAATVAIGRQRQRVGPFLKTATPIVLSALVVALAVYALFFRQPGGRLVDKDAFALRTFRDAYVYWPALVAGLAGFVLVARKRFWTEPAFFLVLAGFSIFFFYRNRVVGEHFWLARRFLPVILPGLLLLASALALGIREQAERGNGLRRAVGLGLLAFIGWQFAVTAAPVAAHVEYRGTIRHLAKLASQIGDRDLAIFESRNAGSDMHVFALPLAYEYRKQVLVLLPPQVDRRMFEKFLEEAAPRFDRVLFVASAGTDLLSSRITATPLNFVPVSVPEYATASWESFPSGPRQKDLGYSIYQLTLAPADRKGFVLDVGYFDELHVLRFLARELTEGRTVRWTGPQSFIAATGLTGGEKTLTMTLHLGGRPENAPPADVEVFFNDLPLGKIRVGDGFREYSLPLPPDAVRAAAANVDPAQIRLLTNTWRPSDYLGGTDDRALGVMVDRVEIH
jgi:hypothetical protein